MSAFAWLALEGALLVTLSVAVWRDVTAHRIPNALVVTALVAAVALNGLAAGTEGLARAALGAGTGLAALLPFYTLKAMGAGDVKLMGAVGAFLGPVMALFAAAATLVMGAAIAIALTLAQRRAAATEVQGSILKQRFPYAVAIAGGALFALWQQGGLG